MDQTATEREERLPLLVLREILNTIRSAESPKDAAAIVMLHSVETAVGIIDNLDPLTAAFIVLELRRQSALGGGYSEIRERRNHAKKILARGKELNIRGMMGLCHARDQVYRETGYFAGI